MYLPELFSSRQSQLIFALAFILAAALTPSTVYNDEPLLAVVFLLVFATTFACTVRALKTNLAAYSGHGILSILSSFLGLVALSACSTGFTCGAASFGILALLIPGFLASFVSLHAVHLVEISIAIQLISLYLMGCFRVKKNISKANANTTHAKKNRTRR